MGRSQPIPQMETAAALHAAAAILRRAGCISPEAEAEELVAAAHGDQSWLRASLARRRRGEPLAWIIGHARFCGETIRVWPDVYVPRPQSEPLALEAAARLTRHGLAVDLCTGSGAVAVVLRRRRPLAHVVAADIDPTAVACARSNGVDAVVGDMAQPFRGSLDAQAHVVTAVVPYVPGPELRLLPRDVTIYEPQRALDGGPDGLLLLRRAVRDAAWLLRPGGSLLLELGGGQAEVLRPALAEAGFADVETMVDEEDDVRAVCCRQTASTSDQGGRP